MKILLLVFILASCSTMTEGTYKKKFHLEDYFSKQKPADVHSMLIEKMKKCYPQSDYPVYEKTVGSFDRVKETGTIYYEIDNQSLGPKPLVIVDIMKDPQGSLIKVYAKGDMFRPATIFKHQVHKWLDGKKVDCHSHGEI